MRLHCILARNISTNSAIDKPAIAQLVEHLTVDMCRNQMVPGSIPGGRMTLFASADTVD